jgi:thioredoxin-related protein
VLGTQFWRGIPVTVIMLASTIAVSAKEPAKAGAGLKWTNDLAIAWQAAREQQRPLLLFVTMEGCVHCQKMKQTTLRDEDVQSDLRTRFIPVALNAKDEPELVKVLRLRLFPAMVVIQPDGDVLESINGYQTPKQLRERLSSTVRQAAHEAKPRTNR